jgi:hypothetical protein
MRGKKAFLPLLAIAVLAITSAAWASFLNTDRRHRGGFVLPCSLDGINPVWHPKIFGNPAVAREYGFVRSRDGSWQVEKNCVRGLNHNP